MESNLMVILRPIFVFCTTPRDVVIPCLLTELAQSSQTVDHSQIIAMNSDAVLVVHVRSHAAFHMPTLTAQQHVVPNPSSPYKPQHNFYELAPAPHACIRLEARHRKIVDSDTYRVLAP